jgi:hypothetical protein
MQTRVDDFHSGVAQGGSDDFRAAIVAVEAGLCYQDSYGTHGVHKLAMARARGNGRNLAFRRRTPRPSSRRASFRSNVA